MQQPQENLAYCVRCNYPLQPRQQGFFAKSTQTGYSKADMYSASMRGQQSPPVYRNISQPQQPQQPMQNTGNIQMMFDANGNQIYVQKMYDRTGNPVYMKMMPKIIGQDATGKAVYTMVPVSQVVLPQSQYPQSQYPQSMQMPQSQQYAPAPPPESSQFIPDKKESLTKESFFDFIPWYLESRLEGIENVEFVDSNLDDEIVYASIMGNDIFAVHGHRDKLNTAIQNLSLLYHIFPDYVFMGHFHHAAEKEIQGAEVIVNGSLCGTDDYAVSLRRMSKPSQKLIIFDGKGRLCTYNLRLS